MVASLRTAAGTRPDGSGLHRIGRSSRPPCVHEQCRLTVGLVGPDGTSPSVVRSHEKWTIRTADEIKKRCYFL